MRGPPRIAPRCRLRQKPRVHAVRGSASIRTGELMDRKFWILAAAVLVAGAAAAKLWVDLRSDRAQGNELAARIAALEAAPPVAPPSMPQSAPDTVAGAVQSAGADSAPPAPAPATRPATAVTPPANAPAQAAPGPQQSSAAALAGMMQNREMVRTMMRGAMGQMYPDLAEAMGFDQQETDAFFDLMARHQEEQAEDSAALLTAASQDAEARREIQRRLVEKQRQQENELSAYLGAKYGKWEEYQATSAARQSVDQLKARLAGAGNSLSDEQVSKLMDAFSAEQKRFLAETREWNHSTAAIESPNLMQETMQRTMASRRQLLDVARPHLTAAQNEQFRMQVDQESGMLQAVMGLMGGQGAQGGAGQGPV